MPKKYWLMKTEPNVYSIDDLKKDKTTCWEGVRNYQARNFMRDEMKVGDEVLFYHSNATPPGVVGLAKVCREAYPDHTAFEKRSKYYDAKSKKDNPTWWMVDLQFVKKFPRCISLDELKAESRLKEMLVVRKGQRLSVQPVEKIHFEVVKKFSQKSQKAV